MAKLQERVAHLRAQFEQDLTRATSLHEVEEIRVQYLGKKGSITTLFGQLKDLSADEKRVVGPLVTSLRQEVGERIAAKKELFAAQALGAIENKQKHFDVTASMLGHVRSGYQHPYTPFIEEIEDVFISLGYTVLDGPEVESDHYNFTVLNIPPDHPARDMYDTFWLKQAGMLLRTHTSSVQGHEMEKKQLPLAGVVPGRCFRHEATDASHDTMFMQCEGFLIDKNVALADLFGTAQTFLKTLYKKDELDIRIRPGYFPFVEPGVEIDMQCPFCRDGCSVCKKSRWIEVFPGGLIHPNVLKACGIDPDEYSGFAFGFGLTRLAMIKYGITDIRHFHSGKLKFLSQF